MKRVSLAGEWRLSEPAAEVITRPEGITGRLPGCNYLDLMAARLIPDPFWGENEKEARKIAERDFVYSKSFTLTAEDLQGKELDLVISGLDTLAVITVNGSRIAAADNVFRTWRFSVKDIVREGENSISILFENPFPHMRQKQAANPMVTVAGVKGLAHIRKVQCHFGWDWGPCLPPAGISGDIALESYDCRIEDCIVRQEHREGKVFLPVQVKLDTNTVEQDLEVRGALTTPTGKTIAAAAAVAGGEASFTLVVEDPQLWWCNGLGEQPLYRLRVELARPGAEKLLDRTEKKLGLRTITLDTAPDKWGAAFRFVINGVPLFAKGADWIPGDSFITRQAEADLRFYIESARRANMNMLRIWGGGYYESDTFYDLCDEYGILVWQDFCFADSAYPFDDEAFLENVHQEVIDNVRRLRHRASLALWSGNNENELLGAMWKRKKKIAAANTGFYYDILAKWTGRLDGTTPYWPGSPSSGRQDLKPNDVRYGDTHLWQIWHGLMPIEYFRKLPARFCSEFGLESFPSIRALRTWTFKPNPSITEPVMMTHQKSLGGNQKILFYLLAKYRGPAKFSDMVYLSQLVQAGAMRFAVDHWRRNRYISGGALYWQYNDCWPVASWAGIDYCKQYKAVHFHARHFNKPVCLSNDYFDNRAEIWLANDPPEDFSGVLQWRLVSFSGETVSTGELPVSVPGLSSQKILTLEYRNILKGRRKNSVALCLALRRKDAAGESIVIDEKNYLLVPDKYAALPVPNITVSGALKEGTAEITLASDVYARYVYIEHGSIASPLSDNFFDIEGGGARTVTVPLPAGFAEKSAEAFTRSIHVHSLAHVEPQNSIAVDRLRRFAMRFLPINFITWFLFKLI